MTDGAGFWQLRPIEVAARLAGRRGRVLLHSGRDDDGCGRRSFVACDPDRTIEAHGCAITVRDRAGDVIDRFEDDPLASLQRMAGAAGCDEPAASGSVPIAIGFLGYDLGRTIEQLGPGPSRGADLPDMWFGFYGAVVRFEPEVDGARVVGRDGVARRALEQAIDDGPRAPGPLPALGELRPDDGADDYCRRVQRIGEYIRAGDVYQVNVARRLVADVRSPGDAVALYRSLVTSSPSAFGALLETGSARIVSGSPELFLSRAPGSDRLETRPIKGTRRRTGEDATDRALARELAADPKECAEHLMIVDLERNDLGRVAITGSVKVDELSYVVELPTLYHMVSIVSCRLRPEVGTADILRATFPGGSITGAPKIRAMQIIDELEPVRRGPYTGAIGFLGRGGEIDLSITIRTAVMTDDELRLHVGGGIVADSTPERELEETEEKAAGWRAALAPAISGARTDGSMIRR